jgi:hypothetical protein
MNARKASPDPTQSAILNWLPVLFSFMLAKFSAGPVICWTWNNSFFDHSAGHRHGPEWRPYRAVRQTPSKVCETQSRRMKKPRSDPACSLRSIAADRRRYGITAGTTFVDVVRIPIKGPGGVSGLMDLIEAGKIEPASILGKTEGPASQKPEHDLQLPALAVTIVPELS